MSQLDRRSTSPVARIGPAPVGVRVRSTLTPIYHSLRELPSLGPEYVRAESRRSERPPWMVLGDALASTLQYGTTFSEFCQFGFASRSSAERKQYITTRRYQRYFALMNDPGSAHLLEDKIRFHAHFKDLTGRPALPASDLGTGRSEEERIFDGGWAVAKPRYGRRGEGVVVISLSSWDPARLRTELVNRGLELIEGYVVQHPDLADVSASGVNTIRVMTQVHSEGIDVLAARLKLTNGGLVDNVRLGGLVAPVDLETGRVVGPARGLDPHAVAHEVHPLSGAQIEGFAVPHWNATLELAREAAARVPTIRSVGWDIAVTPSGPVVIEGNHRFSRSVWQVPTGRGHADEILRFAAV